MLCALGGSMFKGAEGDGDSKICVRAGWSENEVRQPAWRGEHDGDRMKAVSATVLCVGLALRGSVCVNRHA